MFKLLKHLKPVEWLYVSGGVVFIVAQVYLDLKLPDFMKTVTMVSQGNGGTMTDIWANGGWMLLCALGSMACSIITSVFFVCLAANISARLREKLYIAVQGFSMAEINKFSTPSLITRATNDVNQVQMFIVMGLQMMIKAPITAVWGIIKIAGKRWQWSVAMVIAVCIIVITVSIIMLLVSKKVKKLQGMTDKLNQTTRENLTGIRVIRAFNAEKYHRGKFETVNKEFTKTSLFTDRTLALMSPIMSGVMNGVTLAIYWIGAVIIGSANITEVNGLFADMIVFMSYGMQIIGAFMMLAMMFMIAPRAFVSAKRINEVLQTKASVTDGEGVGPTQIRGSVEFKNVSFRYPDAGENVLTDISFNVRQGQSVAIVGAIGCGKSTVVKLLSRFYDATSGEIFIDGHNVKEYTKVELNKKIGYCSQQAVLFSGDIESNINFGDNNADSETIDKAVRISQSAEFIEKQENGLSGSVAQNGMNFSGGQKQRLSVARAIARNAEIYIFDDTFSALDYKTDKALRKMIKEKMQDATLIVIAQRIGTIKDADLILVMEDGKIVGQGKHNELLTTCPTYAEIARSQLSEEELQNA